jgi:hypothetical protein
MRWMWYVKGRFDVFSAVLFDACNLLIEAGLQIFVHKYLFIRTNEPWLAYTINGNSMNQRITVPGKSIVKLCEIEGLCITCI